MKTEEEIEKEVANRIKYISTVENPEARIVECAWFNALQWVLENDVEVENG